MSKSITLIGAGIMSATLGVFLKKLMPDAQITIYERLDQVGAESSMHGIMREQDILLFAS